MNSRTKTSDEDALLSPHSPLRFSVWLTKLQNTAQFRRLLARFVEKKLQRNLTFANNTTHFITLKNPLLNLQELCSKKKQRPAHFYDIQSFYYSHYRSLKEAEEVGVSTPEMIMTDSTEAHSVRATAVFGRQLLCTTDVHESSSTGRGRSQLEQ